MGSSSKPPANLFKRSNGYWYVRRSVQGVEKWVSTGTQDLDHALRRYHEIMTGLYNEGRGWDDRDRVVPTFAEWWATYDKAYMPLKSKATQRRERAIVNNTAMKAFGRRRLDEVPKSLAQKYLNTRGEKVTQDTLTREHSFLQAVWTKAIEDGHEVKNPWALIKREPYSVKQRTVTEGEQEAILGVCSPRFARWMRFMLGTGLRDEECRTITPGSFDWASGTVHVVGKGRNGKKRVRDVPMLDGADRIAKEQLEEGRFFSGSAALWGKELRRYCTRAEVKPFGPHTLRHTFATRYLRGGGNVYTLSKILGHSSVAITERHYAHLLKEDLVKASAGVNLGVRPRVVSIRSKSRSTKTA